MITDTDKAYIAGLFDGEGSVSYKQYMRKRAHNKKAYPTWQIRLEIAMTDQSLLMWLHEVLGVGTMGPRKVKQGRKKQWRWRCSHRDAYYVCLLIWPWSHTKLPKMQKIIKHYADKKIMNDNIVDLLEYKKDDEFRMIKKWISKLDIWSLYYRQEIVWFIIGFVIGALIL